MDSISLDGEWSYLPDPENEGLDRKFFNPIENNLDWKTMELPRNWELGGLHNYCGVVWFRRSFEMDALEKEQTYQLCFGGVDYFAQVWLNEKEVGKHEGYFQPFEFNVTPFLMEGKNEIVVRVDAPREEVGERWPHRKTLIKGALSHYDGRPGGLSAEHGQDGCTGGIWNSIHLHIKSSIRLVQTTIRTNLLMSDLGELHIDFALHSFESGEVETEIEITLEPENFSGDVIGPWRIKIRLSQGDSSSYFRKTMEKPALWETWDRGYPHLYKVVCRLKKKDELVDQVSKVIGFRNLWIDDQGQWELNGQRFFPRGTNFIPTQWLSEYTPKLIENDLRLILGANVNALRITGHVTRPEVLDACDRVGILVWQDFPLQWGYDPSVEFREEACRQIREMVRMFQHHPSIALWCCHNEPRGEKAEDLDRALSESVEKEDPSRKALPASLPSEHAYTGWYSDDYRDFDKLPGSPMVSEFGAQALPCHESLKEMFGDPSIVWPPDWREWDYRNFQYDLTFNVARIKKGDSLDSFIRSSQQYQARLLKYAIEHYRLAKHRGIEGIFQYTFVDSWPSIGFSVVDYFRRPKIGYQALKIAYQPILPVFIFRRRRAYSGGKIHASIAIINDTSNDFESGTAEIALEVEKGTLITWSAKLKTVPAYDAVGDVLLEISNHFKLPSNMTVGPSRITIRLFDNEGRRIAENFDTMEVVEPPPV